jgi:uncharacterized protein (DUF1800 family)
MQRPSMIAVAAGLASLAACGGRSPARVEPAPRMSAMPLEPMPAETGPREQTADEQVNHVLSRLTFGARPGDAEAVRAMGVDRWIDLQLHPERIDDSKSDAYFSTLESYNTSAQELQRKYPPPNQLLQRLQAKGGAKLSSADSAELRQANAGPRMVLTEAQGGRIDRALVSERQLQEVMTDFWLNHFSVYIQKGPPERYQLAHYESRVIRPNALGKFRVLLEAVAKSPAMLFYLDNWESQADSNRPRLTPLPGAGRGGLGRNYRGGLLTPQQQQQLARRRGGLNENYGRELLELHTLGVDGGYTQQDVINVARAFTGWTFPRPQQGGGEFGFNPQMHDAGQKVVLGHKLVAGRGIEDGEDVLDIVSRHPSTARYIAFKLARRFVSDTPPAALVERAAQTFRRTDGDIRAVVRTIVTSPEFFSHAAYRSKVKSPFEVVVSTLRALGAPPDGTPRTAMAVAALGEPIYGHQAPNGWPETGDQWLNTGAILSRINFGVAVAAGRIPGVSSTNWKGAESLRDAPIERQVDGVVDALLGGGVSPDTRRILITGQNPFLASAAALDSTTAMARPTQPLKGLALIVGLAIGSPEFQRR